MKAEKAKLTRPGAPAHGRIAAVTLTTTDLDRVERAYVEALELRPVARGRVDRSQAESWGAPAEQGSRWLLLEPPNGCGVYLRWIESAPWPAGCKPRASLGWAALECTVRDADAMCRRLAKRSDFKILGEPAALPGLDQIYPMQAEGPAGEVVYLNEIRGDLPQHDLPRASCWVDRVFIVVLGVADLPAATRFYTDQLGFEPANSYEIPYQMINQAFELPASTSHRLVTTAVGRQVNVEIDQYPPQAVPRPTVAGRLPPAMAMVSFEVEDLRGCGVTGFTAPHQVAEQPYGGASAVTCRGAGGELVELIEVRGDG